ncbi:MAG: glycosyltransferase family 39 protein [Planctomycetes bacterium]|nr:glycosyltransferase family 39 protein [Planctomycetota bacterium]
MDRPPTPLGGGEKTAVRTAPPPLRPGQSANSPPPSPRHLPDWAAFGRRSALAIVVALAIVARLVRYAVDFPIWGDEAFVACSLLARDLAGLLQPLEFEMVVPLGWLLPTGWLVERLGGSTLVLRLPALLAGLAALLLFAGLARRLLPRRTALLAVAWFGGSYYLIRHSAEVKPYAFDLLAGVLLYDAALRIVRCEPRAWLRFALLGALASWCSYPAIFVASGAGLAAALLQATPRFAPTRQAAPGLIACHPDMRSRSLHAPALLALALVAASFAAMYLAFGHAQQWSEERIADARHWDDHFLPLAEPWRWPWWLLRELTGNLLAYPNGGPAFGSSATFLLVVAGAVAWWRRGRRAELLLLLAPLAPMLAASALRKYPFGGSARIALHLAIPICLLAASGVAGLAERVARWRGMRAATRSMERRPLVLAKRRAQAAATLLLAAFAIGSAVRDVAKPWKTRQDRNHRAAFAWLEEQVQPGDVVALFGRFEDGAADGAPSDATADAPLDATTGASADDHHSARASPDLRGWRGSAGRLRYELLLLARRRGVTLRFAPEPATLAREPSHGALWSVTYRDNEAPFPDAVHEQWQAELTATFGPPLEQRPFVIGGASPDPATGSARQEQIEFVRRRGGSDR